MIQHLTVAGDFDQDGDDDIGTLYDYYGDRCEVAAHMFLSTRTDVTWVGRGRFDGVIQSVEASPGVFKDKWVGSWIYEGWWDGMWRNWWYAMWIEDQPASVDRGKYCPDKARRRMVAGDLDGNGIDDIGVLYDWGQGRGSVDSFLSIGNGFRLRSMFTTGCMDAALCAP